MGIDKAVCVVLDKSYLDGTSTEQVERLCLDHTVLMPDVLFYELLTTDDEKRIRCFRKIPDKENPFELLPNIDELLRYEQQNNKPCTPIYDRCLPIRYTLNFKLGFDTKIINTQKKQIEEDTNAFIESCLHVREFFPEWNGIEYKCLPRAIEEARSRVASNINFIRDVYGKIRSQAAPSANEIDQRWAHFRWTQCKLLSALRIFKKYQGKLPNNSGENFWVSAEHSMLDVYYVIFGALCGAIASGDAAVIDDFKLICPGGLVFDSRMASPDKPSP